VAAGQVDQLTAAVRQAELDLSYTKLNAPEAGRVTRKSVEPGAYVQVGQTLFSIVPDRVWVVANFKETQLRHMRPGQPATVTVDAYPDRVFTGHVDSIQAGSGARFSLLPPENATGNYVKVVQRVPVKIVIDGARRSATRARPRHVDGARRAGAVSDLEKHHACHRYPRPPAPEWGWRSPRCSARTVTVLRSCRAAPPSRSRSSPSSPHSTSSRPLSRRRARPRVGRVRPRGREAAPRHDRRARVLAGRPHAAVPFATELTHDNVGAWIDVYVHGAVAAVNQVLPDMLSRRRGTIMFTTCASSVHPAPACAAAAAAMAWLRNWAHALHAAVAPNGVQVGHVAIGAAIGSEPQAIPDAIGPLYWELHTHRHEIEKVYLLDVAEWVVR